MPKITMSPGEVWQSFAKTTPNALLQACRELHTHDVDPEYCFPREGAIIGYGAALRRAGYTMNDATDLMVRQVRKEATAALANLAEAVDALPPGATVQLTAS